MRQTAYPPRECDGTESTPAAESRPGLLSVGVIVDLFQGPSAGGHVKTWERIARAACGQPVDLTVYFLGPRQATFPLSPNVRYVAVPPLFSTTLLPFLKGIPADTDLAPLHWRLLSRFRTHDVLHATGAYFSMARAARFVSRRNGPALVHSTHTETPQYTRLYADQMIQRFCGPGLLGRLLRERWRLPDRLQKKMEARLSRYLNSCDWVLVSDAQPPDSSALGPDLKRVTLLRRGIDRDAFHPRHRDRQRLQQQFGIPPDRPVLLFAGRLDAAKDVLTVARATGLLLGQGQDVHLVCAGQGNLTAAIRDLLPARASLPGQLPEDTLAWLYASADLFVFSSQIEVFPNVILEAKASALPAIVSARALPAQFAAAASEDAGAVQLASNQPALWAQAIAALLNQPARRRALGEAARRWIETSWPSWQDVLREDLLPVWERVARKRRRAR